MLARLLRFGAVGGLVTGVSYVLFLILLDLDVHYLPASATCWLVGVVISYALNRRITFALKSRGDSRERVRFFCGCVLQLLISLVGYRILMGALAMSATPAFLMNVACSALFSFTFMRWFVFAQPIQRARNAHV